MSVAEVTDAWTTRRLRDAVTKLVDGSHNPPPKQEIGLPMLSARNVEQGKIVFDDFRFISDDAFVTENARTRVAPGDVLLTIVGTIGRSAVVPQGIGPFALQRSVAVLTPRADLDPRFLSYQLQSPRIQRHFETHARGTAQKGVYLKTLGETPLVLPGIDEQLNVVAEIEKQFSRLDEAVANLQRVKANLKRYRAATLAAATQGWPVVRLGALLREPLRNGHSAKATDDPNGLRAFTLSAVTQGDFSERNTKRTVADARRVADLWARPGDIFVERSNTPELVGTARLYRGPENFAFIPDLLIRVRVSEGVLPSYAAIALECDAGRRFFRSRAQGISGTMPKIDQGAIEAFPMPLPPLADQHRVVAEVDRRLSIVREVEAEVDANLTRAQALRQSVLQAAFACKLPA